MLCGCLWLLSCILRATPQSSSVNVVEDLRLDVVPCAPGYYCAPDGSIMEPCPEGSQHVVLEEADRGLAALLTDEFAICSTGSSSTRALLPADAEKEKEKEELLDIGFVIDFELTMLNTTEGTLQPQQQLFWAQLLEQLSQEPNVLDVSYQEYLALDVTQRVCPKGHYCSHDVQIPCPLGTYGPFEGPSASCVSCPWGLSSAAEGSTSFQNCTLGAQGAEGEWLPLSVPEALLLLLEDALPLAPQLATYFGVPAEAVVQLSSL